MESNPVMEAFGNALSSRNSNSRWVRPRLRPVCGGSGSHIGPRLFVSCPSRFGKFVSLQFSDAGFVLGALVANYLLEKSRIVHQVPGERSFHMFYQLCVGAMEEEREALALPGPAPQLDGKDMQRVAKVGSGVQAALRWADEGGGNAPLTPEQALPSRVRRRSVPVPDDFGLVGMSDPAVSKAQWGGGVAHTGPQLRAQLAAGPPGSMAFRCLLRGGTVTIDGVDDATELVLTRRAMMAVGIDAVEQALILRVVASVLHLSEVNFQAEGGEDCAVTHGSALRLRHVCGLLRVDHAEVRAAGSRSMRPVCLPVLLLAAGARPHHPPNHKPGRRLLLLAPDRRPRRGRA